MMVRAESLAELERELRGLGATVILARLGVSGRLTPPQAG